MIRPIRVGEHTLGPEQFCLIAGPCVIESEEHTLKIAEQLAAMARELGVFFIFKASFDKANRSSLQSYRGPGLKTGMAILRKVKQTLHLPVLSDIHTPEQAEFAAEVLDVLQIPAFLSRQTDLLLAAGKAGQAVNIKKGQFTAPQDMGKTIEKVASLNSNILVTERGYTFGYNNLVVDMRAFAILSQFGYPVIFDATHSVQLPGGGVQSSGESQYVPLLARAAAGAGINGLFLETHEDPKKAPSDGATMIPLKDLASVLRPVLAIHRCAQSKA